MQQKDKEVVYKLLESDLDKGEIDRLLDIEARIKKGETVNPDDLAFDLVYGTLLEVRLERALKKPKVKNRSKKKK